MLSTDRNAPFFSLYFYYLKWFLNLDTFCSFSLQTANSYRSYTPPCLLYFFKIQTNKQTKTPRLLNIEGLNLTHGPLPTNVQENKSWTGFLSLRLWLSGAPWPLQYSERPEGAALRDWIDPHLEPLPNDLEITLCPKERFKIRAPLNYFQPEKMI